MSVCAKILPLVTWSAVLQVTRPEPELEALHNTVVDMFQDLPDGPYVTFATAAFLALSAGGRTARKAG